MKIVKKQTKKEGKEKMKTLTKTTNRFNGTLDHNHGVLLNSYNVNGRKIEIRTTIHSLERFEFRGVDVKKSLNSITRLGTYGLNRLATDGTDTGINDYRNNTTTILTFESDSENYVQVRIRTIIGRGNAYLKPGTKRIVLR